MLPAWDGYGDVKAPLFLPLEPGWAPFFADDDAQIDWRMVSWGGRSYPPDLLQGRDAAGPDLPDRRRRPRLPVQAVVLGVITQDGTPIAFPVEAARAALAAGEPVSLAGVEVVGRRGLRARMGDGAELASHQAFWFAWSQFYPHTDVWEG